MSKFNDLTKLAIALGIFILFMMPTAYSSSDATNGSDDEPIPEDPFEDDFESYEDFVLDFPPWTQFDGDGAATYGFEENEFPNEYYEGSYIIFNPSESLVIIKKEAEICFFFYPKAKSSNTPPLKVGDKNSTTSGLVQL